MPTRLAGHRLALVLVAGFVGLLAARPLAAQTTIFSDGFGTDQGWVVNPLGTDTATTGQWQRGNPEPTSSGGTALQLDLCAGGTPNCLATGLAAGASAGANDVDGGLTSIQSPPIALPSSGATLTFNFYLAHLNNSSADDFFRVRIVRSSGDATTVFQKPGAAVNQAAAFVSQTVDLSPFAGQTIRIRLEAADNAAGSLLEAAVDDVKVVSTPAATPLVQVFQHCDFSGWQANFTSAGNFNTADLVARGGIDNDASSVKVATGFKVTLFDGDNQTGTAVVLGAGNTACLVNNNFNDVLSSLRVEQDAGGDVDNTIQPCGRAPDANGQTVDFLQVHIKHSIPIKVCVSAPFWNGTASARTDIPKFFDYIDGLVPELQTLFSFKPTPQPAGAPFIVEIKSPFGGASTGVDSTLGSNIGDTITGDAYSNTFNDSLSGKSVKGFFGFLLTLHELINVWTGEMTSGWPTDWWADHRSPFPNSMDEEIMRDLGTRQNNQTLLDAATIQRSRFLDPRSGSFDKEVGLFDSFFDRFGGFTPYNRAFSLVRGDGLHWDAVSASNPSPLRTEYVIAYVQLGLRTGADLTQSDFVAAGVSQGTAQDPPYTISSTDIGDVADAHCSIASARNSGRNVSTQLAALQRGDFLNAKLTAGCGTPCPGECGCDTTVNQCVAPWRAR